MGAEFKFKFQPQDFAAFETDIRGKTLDSVLRNAPGFVEFENGLYQFNESQDIGNKWLATVSVEEDGLMLCYYGDGSLVTHLMWAILDVCGRLSMEDG